jgi:photosystem II stability/assembly factor-like uncharacterized protein
VPTTSVTALEQIPEQLSGLTFLDAGNGIGVTGKGAVVATSDGGGTWHPRGQLPDVNPGDERPRVAFGNRSTGFAYDGWGARPALVSRDGGATWSSTPTHSVRALAVIDTSVWALEGADACAAKPCTPGALAVSDDSGRSWVLHSIPTVTAPTGLVRVSRAEGYIAGRAFSDGGKFKAVLAATRDAGATWSTMILPCAGIALQLTGNHSELWLACGAVPATIEQPKEIYASRDGGHSWTLQGASWSPQRATAVGNLPLDGALTDISDTFMSPGRSTLYVALGRNGLWASTDSGRSWHQPFPFQTDTSFGGFVTFLDAKHGWATAEHVLWRTTDGTNWTPLGTPHP